jgi:ferredoxin
MKGPKRDDEFLRERVDRYDRWLREGGIAYSSKVIPVSESIDGEQWVLPTEQAEEILRRASSVAVQDCECRTHYQRCNHPREVCLLLDDIADGLVARGEARLVNLREAAEILKKANESGLVHLTLYRPDHRVYALCSCCSCCCHDLQIIEAFGRPELMVRSDYLAATDEEACIDCGACVERCAFGARTWKDGRIEYDPAACVGCGLCVTICPADATAMVTRRSPA